MTNDERNATIKALLQVQRIQEKDPAFLPELLRTRLSDLGVERPEQYKKKGAGQQGKSRKGKKSAARGKQTQSDRMPEHWKVMLRFIGKKSEASLDDLLTFAIAEKLPITPTKDVLRSQMAEYAKESKHLVKRVKPGVFSLTETGKKRVGYVPA